MSSIVNKVKEALHHDKDESKDTTDNKHTTHTTHNEPRTGTTTGAGIGSHDGAYTTGDNYGLGGNNRGTDGPATKTDGPHSSNVANKVDPRVDSDRDHSKNLGANPHGTATTTGSNTHTTTGTSGLAGTTGHSTSTTAGPHSSNLANKTDPRVDSDLDGSRNMGATTTHGTTGTHGTSGLTGTTGHSTTHHSGGYAAGAGNPLGTGAAPAAHQQASHNTSGLATGTAAGAGAGLAGHHATTGTHTHGGTTIGDNRGFDGPASKTDGPHSSNLANKVDPRVDSDRDHSKNLGANPHGTATTGNTSSTTHGTTGSGAFFTGSGNNTHSTYGNTGMPATTGTGTHDTTGLTGTHGTTGTSGLTGSHGTTGTSGLTGTHNTTGTSGLTGTHGTTGASEGAFGPHSSRVANAADPRVDSDRDNRANIGATGAHHSGLSSNQSGLTGTHATHGTTGATGAAGGLAGSTHPGPAPNTAGPHKSDMLNKVDPRVDSDRDGSKTVGGDKTTGSSMAHKDPTDAAQVPPSVLQKHVGGVYVAHDDHSHDRERRHSVSHQEQHRGL